MTGGLGQQGNRGHAVHSCSISETTRLLGPSFLVKDFLAQIDAVVADLDCRPGRRAPRHGLATEAAFRLGLSRFDRDQLDEEVGTLLTHAQNLIAQDDAEVADVGAGAGDQVLAAASTSSHPSFPPPAGREHSAS